ncbi:MAG: hypothetical protein MUE82_09120, partial [Chloroflexi bacterium]|nr:hypothetical protein [Chloroflexota bacterium]
MSDLQLRGKRARERRAGDRAVEAAHAARRAAPAAVGGASRRRPPDLASLVRLLGGTEPFARLRERLGRPGAGIPPAGRHAALAGIPHGSKTYLAAALALDPPGERLCWVARDAE